MTQITRNFSSSEFDCRCGKCHSKINVEFVKRLQELRDIVGIPLPISSGVRCAAHNMAEGGAPNSRHIYGDAADITWTQMSGEERMRLLAMAYKLGFTGVGIAANFLHLDTRAGHVAFWTY